jgi:hypothetical protein
MKGPFWYPNSENNREAISRMEYDRLSPPGSEEVDDDFGRDLPEAVKEETSNENA